MSSHEVRLSSSASIPRPRTSERTTGTPSGTAPDAPAVGGVWSEPGRAAVGTRPSSDYWDVTTASWRSVGTRQPSGD